MNDDEFKQFVVDKLISLEARMSRIETAYRIYAAIAGTIVLVLVPVAAEVVLR